MTFSKAIVESDHASSKGAFCELNSSLAARISSSAVASSAMLSGSADRIIGLLLLSFMAPPFLLELTITQKILHLGPYDKILTAGHDPIKIFSA